VRLIYVRKNANIKKTVMPKISVVFYQEDAKIVPVLDWLDRLPPEPKINAGFVSSGYGIWGMNCAGRKRIT